MSKLKAVAHVVGKELSDLEQAHRELAAYVRKQGLCPSMFGQTAPGPDALIATASAGAEV